MNCRLNWVVITLFTLTQNFFAQATDYTPRYARFNINRISTIIYNDGRMDHNIETGEAAFEYPKGSGKTAVYQSGFFWGGGVLQKGFLIGGSIYRTALKPGAIFADGSVVNPNSEESRVYRVRCNYSYSDISDDIEKDDRMYEDVMTQYNNDWNEWPAEKGAPFEDNDGNGIYNPTIDVPGVPGADQTLWFVANDFDSVQTDFFVPLGYPNLPAGIEMQVTLWGYDREDCLGNVIFKKYKIINKSKDEQKILDMCFSQFSDPFLDENNNDFVGCDTVLSLGFAYNAKSMNEKYSYEPPAFGCLLLKGAKVYSDNHFENRHFENLGMTSFHYVPYRFRYGESHMWYAVNAMLNGRMPTNGVPIFSPDKYGGGRTFFPFPGDPVTRIGWLDSFEREPWDNNGHRIMVNSGPFNMAYGDTQEVVFAVIAAGAEHGVDNIGAVSLLKHYARQVQQFYDNNFNTAKAEIKPIVSGSVFDREVVLSWGNDIENINNVEKSTLHDFTFQGYNVYQLPTENSSISNGIKIATFDKIDGVAKIIEDKLESSTGRVVPMIVQEGNDKGVERYIRIDKDYLNDQPLNNGTKYHFGVSAYYYNPKQNTSPIVLETEPEIVSLFPQSELPGKRYEADFGDKISVHPYSSATDVDIMVIDPSQLTGHDYEITFNESAGQLLWNLEDVTSGEIKLADQTNITGTDEYYIIDGFRIIITQDTSSLLTSSDVFTFNTPAVTKDEELAKLDVEKINVFPNPYYGGHGNELNQYHNYVMFNHLPQRVTFRIFNLAGHLVRTLYKDDDTQFYLWDLQNENRMLASSGLYIIYIEMPDLQKVKVLKLAIVQREVVPGNF